MIPFIDLSRKKFTLDSIEVLFDKKNFIGGDPVSALEDRLCQELDTKHCITCANGTDALQLALRSFNIGPGDRVLVPEYTFWATAEAVVNVGAIPIAVDIDTTDKCMDFDLFCTALEKFDPAGVILVHILGWCSARIEEFRLKCQEYSIPLIEDGAQSFGTEMNGESIFKDAECITTSFYPAKVLGGCGDGGAVFTKDAGRADQIRMLSNHGRSGHYEHTAFGWNSRLDSINAVYLLQRIESIDQEINERLEIEKIYTEALRNVAGVETIVTPKAIKNNGYLYTVTFETEAKRNKVKDILSSFGVSTAITYPIALSEQPAYKAAGYKRLYDPSIAKDFGKRLLNLPMFPGLTQDEKSEVIAGIITSLKG